MRLHIGVSLLCHNFRLTLNKGSPSGYTASSYLWSIALGNGESLSLGNQFSFWLVDGGYDVQVYSPSFYLRDPNASSSVAASSSTTSFTTSTSSTTSSSTPTTSSQSSSVPVSTVASATGITATPTSPPAASVDTSSGLSTGAKVGVAVGVVAAFALGLGLAYLLFRRRESSKMAGATSQPVPMYSQNNEMKPYEPTNTDPYGYYGQRELPGDQPQNGGLHPYQTAQEVP
jgi:hypothetical protein